MGRPTEWLVSCAHSLPTLDFSLTTRVAKIKVTDRQLAPRSRFIRKIVGTHGRGYLNSGMLTETVGDEDGIGGGAGEGMARNGMEKRGGSREHDDP